MLATLVVLLVSCKKNDPITELGDSDGEYYPMLRVTYSSNLPNVGDSVVVTASTWQRDDKIAKVEMTETAIEMFGLDFKMKKGTHVLTLDREDKLELLVITDTISNNVPWFEVNNTNNELNKYFVTESNNYIIQVPYVFELKTAKYVDDASVINELNSDEFNVLKSILAYAINQEDYKEIFPSAPSDHYSTGAYALSKLGMDNLKENLTKQMLVNSIVSFKKVGDFSSKITINVITPSGAVKSSSNSFQAIL